MGREKYLYKLRQRLKRSPFSVIRKVYMAIEDIVKDYFKIFSWRNFLCFYQVLEVKCVVATSAAVYDVCFASQLLLTYFICVGSNVIVLVAIVTRVVVRNVMTIVNFERRKTEIFNNRNAEYGFRWEHCDVK